MPDSEVLFIFHYDGNFKFNIIRLVYIEGRQKMRYLPMDITYASLLNEANEAGNCGPSIQNLNLQYLHHNGRAFSLASIDNDNDVRRMLKASGNDVNGIYLYVFNCENDGHHIGGEQRRFQGTYKDRTCPKKLRNVSRVSNKKEVMEPLESHELPTVDLHEDEDMHFETIHNDLSPDQPVGQEEFDDDMDDMFFQTVPADLRTHQSVEQEETVDDMDVGKVSHGNIKIEKQSPNKHIRSIPTLKGEVKTDRANPSYMANVSNEAPHLDLDDNMVPEEVHTDIGSNSTREMWLGRKFPDRQNFRNTLAKFAIYGNFTLKHLKTNLTKVTARCKDPEFPWRIHDSIVESGPQFKVRTYNPNHRCSKPMMGMAHRQATSALITEFIMDRVRQNPDLKPKEIMNDYQMEFGSTISYRKALIAKEMALRVVRGSYEDSFKILPLYCIELKMANTGTVTNIDTVDDRFRRFFWAFGPCLRSFTCSLRRLIAVDGTHLRGKYPGVLLVAVTHDANHKLLPIAFAFAEAECRDSWEWFLANLFISLGEPSNLTIVSDCQKGFVPAFKNTIPAAMHCYCCRHIAENIKAAFSDGAIVLRFWRAAKSYRPCEYEAYMTDIHAVSRDAFNYIDTIGRERWANAYVQGRRYEMLTSNAAECTNGLLRDIRVLPITKQVEEIRAKLMEYFQKRQLLSQSVSTRLTPYAEKILSQKMDEARRVHVRVAGLVEFQVQSAEYVNVVDLERRTCTCRKWELLGIPCCHALASMKVRNYDPYNFCEHWYLSEVYRSTYSELIHATRDSKQWEHTSDMRVLPPIATKQPGHPRKKRLRTKDSYHQRKVVTCSNCRGRGHNRGSCRNPPALT